MRILKDSNGGITGVDIAGEECEVSYTINRFRYLQEDPEYGSCRLMEMVGDEAKRQIDFFDKYSDRDADPHQIAADFFGKRNRKYRSMVWELKAVEDFLSNRCVGRGYTKEQIKI